MRYGVPASGPMDRSSFAIANAALGNQHDAPAIEVSMGGLVLDCISGSVTIAIAGGGFDVSIDGVKYPSWTAITIRSGSRLTIKPGSWGSWAYLAFAGNMHCARWLSSAATHIASGFGGGTLKANAVIEIASAEVRSSRVQYISYPPPTEFRRAIRVILGPKIAILVLKQSRHFFRNNSNCPTHMIGWVFDLEVPH